MRIFGALLVVLSIGAVEVQGQEPRLPAPATPPGESEALIQRARTLSSARNYRESAAVWQTVAAREPVIAPLATRESIRALIAAGDIEPAIKGLTELGSAAPPELLLRAADACRAAGAFDCAVTMYRRARQEAGRTPAADEAALGLARALEQAGDAHEALETYRELQLTFRDASAFELADGAARRLSAQLQGAEPLSEDDYEEIVARLAGVAAFRRAVDMQVEWLKAFPDTSERKDIEASMVQHLYSLRANDDARYRAHAFLKAYSDTEEAADVFVTLFRLDVREGRTADVEKRGRALMGGEIAGATLSDRQGAARLLAEYLVSVGQPAKALGVYNALYKISLTRASRVDVLWRMAIASLRAGNPARASKELQQVLRLKPDSETFRAASFWLAYALDASGSKEAARKQWADLARRQPFTYYGTRAATRAGTPLPAASVTFPELRLRDTVLEHPDYQAAALLSRAGLLSEAAVHARRLNAAFRRDDAVALLAARASEAAGDYSSSSTLMSSYFGAYLQQPATNLPDDFWTLAYPRAYWAEVSAAAARYNVDPLLMIGLARQESHFDRMARSPVGAVGLFQVMPYTAAELDPAFSNPAAMDRLVQPEVSAELAAKLLSSLQARYQGALAPTIASYNADKERVQIWWDAAKGLPEELFIDSIPYQQTRAYVRQVLTNYAMYQRSAQSALPRK
ncbi:MAG TPA: lytic transglycosylase domain-containing protein [Vicinamibacterales bacterium]|nr:lytic transglycosylase domain-containing protein [Vicinamibacterales bacterium]